MKGYWDNYLKEKEEEKEQRNRDGIYEKIKGTIKYASLKKEDIIVYYRFGKYLGCYVILECNSEINEDNVILKGKSIINYKIAIDTSLCEPEINEVELKNQVKLPVSSISSVHHFESPEFFANERATVQKILTDMVAEKRGKKIWNGVTSTLYKKEQGKACWITTNGTHLSRFKIISAEFIECAVGDYKSNTELPTKIFSKDQVVDLAKYVEGYYFPQNKENEIKWIRH